MDAELIADTMYSKTAWRESIMQFAGTDCLDKMHFEYAFINTRVEW